MLMKTSLLFVLLAGALAVNAKPKSAYGMGFVRNKELRAALGGKEALRWTYDSLEVPDSFDSRKQWPGCVHPVRDQGQCGSCWAFGAAESLSDRFCIASHGSVMQQRRAAVQEIVSCTDFGLEACNGGDPISAFTYTSVFGVVYDECIPYVSGGGSVPDCPSNCTVSNEPWVKHYSRLTSLSWLDGETAMQNAIFQHGPIETCFDVYSDFMTWNISQGVYSYKSGELEGGHCTKAVGWGVWTDGTPYWLIQNSWGPDWGYDGFFLIKRGVDECGIEGEAFAVLPDL